MYIRLILYLLHLVFLFLFSQLLNLQKHSTCKLTKIDENIINNNKILQYQHHYCIAVMQYIQFLLPMITWAPSLHSALAVSYPIPLFEPVTIATFSHWSGRSGMKKFLNINSMSTITCYTYCRPKPSLDLQPKRAPGFLENNIIIITILISFFF